MVVGTAHTPGLTGPGLPACLRPGCSCAHQAFGTLGIGPAPIARRYTARIITAANQQIGAIIIGTARIPDIAPRAARADPGYTHQAIRAMAIDTAQGTAHTCAGLPAYPGTGLPGTYQPVDTFAIGGTGTALGYLGGAAPCPGAVSASQPAITSGRVVIAARAIIAEYTPSFAVRILYILVTSIYHTRLHTMAYICRTCQGFL